MRTLPKLVACLALSLLVGLPAGRGVSVLCIGSDGHVAVEYGSGSCGAGAIVPSEDSAQGMACEDDCGPCVDVPIGATSLVRVRYEVAPLSTIAAALPVMPS